MYAQAFSSEKRVYGYRYLKPPQANLGDTVYDVAEGGTASRLFKNYNAAVAWDEKHEGLGVFSLECEVFNKWYWDHLNERIALYEPRWRDWVRRNIFKRKPLNQRIEYACDDHRFLQNQQNECADPMPELSGKVPPCKIVVLKLGAPNHE